MKNQNQENLCQKKLSQTLKPEAAEKLEMKEQEERENARLQDEKRLAVNEEKGSNGYWHYIPDCDDYMWVGRLVVTMHMIAAMIWMECARIHTT